MKPVFTEYRTVSKITPSTAITKKCCVRTLIGVTERRLISDIKRARGEINAVRVAGGLSVY